MTIPRPQPDTGGDGAPPALEQLVDDLHDVEADVRALVADGVLYHSAKHDAIVTGVADRLRWLASHLPELMADAKLLDALVASPAQITVGNLTLREIRDHFRAGANAV